MTIETGCGGCGRRLRVADEHAGKLARCPNCNTIYRVPSPDGTPVAEAPRETRSPAPAPAREPAPSARSPAPAPSAPSAARQPAASRAGRASASMWRMRTPEGQVYGPVPRHELNSWVREGRVSSDCELCENDGNWLWADRVYPELARVGAPMQDRGTHRRSGSYPVEANRLSVGGNRVAPDRGSTVLALGIMAWIVICPLLSLSAWIMGSHDLREMRSGRMSTTGMGMTQAGMVLGIVHFICAGLFLMFLLMANT